MNHPRIFVLAITTLLVAFFAAAATPSWAQTKLTSAALGAIEARHIGPATMSGRITAIEVADRPIDLQNPKSLAQRVVYVGSASGGVWKSLDNATTFKPIFDKVEKASQSIGALAIDPTSNGNTVWVGTGESNTRNSVSIGTGIYKTTDGGENWKLMGLEKSERIAKIALHPKNPDIVFVAVPGALWSDSEDRGLYRSTDGGKTWEKALYIDNKTGCADVAIDPSDPNIMYASMWTFRRQAWSFSSGGKSGGLFKSTDGGKTWRKLTKDLPEGEIGRCIVTIAPSTSATVYAVVEAKKTRLWRSKDKGESWEPMSDAVAIGLRPFYFASLVVDPTDPDRVYKPGLSLAVSSDGGKTFNTGFGGSTHSDHHALWIDPRNPMTMLLGTDGGVYRSFDRGTTWLFVRSLPVSQFYRVGIDMEQPYNVFGGLQDNGSWMGPSSMAGSIPNSAWRSVGFGDGFWVLRDRTDKNILYFEYQGGEMFKHYLATGEVKSIKPQPKEGDPSKFRFNWNTPLAFSPKNPKVLYAGAQFLFRSTDKGESWEKISPDLTTNDSTKQQQESSGGLSLDISAAENHCTIYSIAESPLDEKIIWVGTDDGNVQITTNGGKTWTNVAANIPGLPPNTWVSMIEPSRFDKNTAYATFDNHMRGDFATYVYKTTDLGKTWKRLESTEFRGYAHAVREDLVNRNLLFVGTEMGLWLTVDGGENWAQFTGNMPNVAVRDIQIHPREHDVVLATHGRGIMIIDDITPIRALTPNVLASELAILPSRPTRMDWSRSFQDFPGDDEFSGASAPRNGLITYYMKDRMMMGDLKVEVLNDKGEVITSITGSKRRGINRVSFALRRKAPKVAASENLAGGALTGPLLPEGTYTVRITKGDKQFTSTLVLEGDPKSPYSAAERKAQHTAVMALYTLQERFGFISAGITSLRDSLKARVASLDSTDAVRKSVTKAAGTLDSLYRATAKEQGFYVAEKEDKLREHITALYAALNGYGGAPSKVQLERLAFLEREVAKVNSVYEALVKKELDGLNAALKSRNLPAVSILTKEEFDKRQN